MGINYDSTSDTFVFDFEHDGKDDIIHLTGEGHEVEAFGKCFHYAYQFTDQVEGSVRSAFIKFLKFTPELAQHPDLTRFIQKAINNLSRHVNLYEYDLVVMPQSQSKVNQYMLRYLYRFAQPMMRQMELVKSLPEKIRFDMDGYEQHYLNDVLENGRPRYTEEQKRQVRESIAEMMDTIHHKDYFTIAKDVRKSRLRPYVTSFLTFQNDEDRALWTSIRNQNVLVVDDIATSGSTLNEILRSLRVLNDTNHITIFSLIGRDDLMAETM